MERQPRTMNAEQHRLEEARGRRPPWRKWGPYLSERQWGTVREDYSPHGTAWDYFGHDMALSRAYRWGEDGIGGLSDERQRICLSVALWNGRDPFLKERLFGLTGTQGNHGEDVKELYYYLDATPTHSYLKMLYKYPQEEFPYRWLTDENVRRGKDQPEFELIDTGVFDEDRYFDVFIEYAKASAEDILLKITAFNRGSLAAELHVLPQIWFRNTWSWGLDGDARKPAIKSNGSGQLGVHHPNLGNYRLYFVGQPELLFCENETNAPKRHGLPSGGGHFKDGFHEYVVGGDQSAVNPALTGTKAAVYSKVTIPPGEAHGIRLRLTKRSQQNPFADFDRLFSQRVEEADEFFAELQREIVSEDARAVQRQALAGIIWSKQFYYYDIPQWLNGDPAQPKPPRERLNGRNSEWQHLNNADVISMPDKWEYPWYAAWDLAFHCVPLALVDAEFAKQQLVLLTRVWYMHPNGQMPAYEWAFGDVNPPVHAWATWRVY